MRLSVLGGCGAWPAAGRACSGYLVEHDGFTVLVDPGYATLPRLLEIVPAERVDAVLVSHGHPDHTADLHPLLRARALGDDPPPPLPVHTLPGAVDGVVALDRPGMLDDAYVLREFAPGDRFQIGPFQVETGLLPHFVPNAGLRLRAGGRILAYTGDTGPSPDVVALARDADVFLAEATYAWRVPAGSEAYLSTGKQAGEHATQAGVGRLLLTHVWPTIPPVTVMEAARHHFEGPTGVATAGLVVDLG
jgi:ribonuclease BN (tRNA processing enzyme)